MENLAEVGRIYDGTFVPVMQKASKIADMESVTVEEHMHDDKIHVSGETLDKLNTIGEEAKKLTNPQTIDGVSFDSTKPIAHYAICSTAASTAIKLVTLDGFSLVVGAAIDIKFTNANTATTPVVRFNGSTTSIPIAFKGSTVGNGKMIGEAGKIYRFVYDGTNLELLNPSPFAITATLAVASWVGTAAPYTYTLTATGLLATDMPIFEVVPSATVATGLSQQLAWSNITAIETADNSVKFTCYEAKPTVAIPILIRVRR